MDEKKIIALLKNGDVRAMRLLMALYKDYVFTLSLRVVKKKELAEEATQDVFVKVFRKINSFDGRSQFRSWLYSVTYRTCLNYLDKKEIKSAERMVYPHDINERPGSLFTDSALADKDIKKILWAAIDRLPRMQALGITLYYLQGFSVNEISQVLKVPVNTVKTHLFRGRKILYILLRDQFKQEELL